LRVSNAKTNCFSHFDTLGRARGAPDTARLFLRTSLELVVRSFGWPKRETTGLFSLVHEMPALPILLVQGNGVTDDDLSALLQSPRVQIFRAPDLHTSPTAFARKTARATILATLGEPLAEVVFARTSGFVGPLILAVSSDYADIREDVLESGALACLTLPLSEVELHRALDIVELQPVQPLADPTLGLFLDPIDRTARHGSAVVRLTPREFAVMHCLIGNRERPVTVQEIYDYVWGGVKGGDSMQEIVHVNVSQLRKKLAEIGLQKVIRTVRGFGYGLQDETRTP
jgi:DNA-binding response OmpR family regulator